MILKKYKYEEKCLHNKLVIAATEVVECVHIETRELHCLYVHKGTRLELDCLAPHVGYVVVLKWYIAIEHIICWSNFYSIQYNLNESIFHYLCMSTIVPINNIIKEDKLFSENINRFLIYNFSKELTTIICDLHIKAPKIDK